MENNSNWKVYIVRCKDNSLYTGITNNIDRRLKQHNGLLKGGSKYTRSKRPVTLVYTESHESKSLACKKENQIKKISKKEKEELIKEE